MRIGIVLPGPPGYTETFFRSKIKGLLETGHEVILFTTRKDKSFNLCEIIYLPTVNGFKLILVVKIAFTIFTLLMRSPRNAFRFYVHEKREGRTIKETIENFYLNAPILLTQLDWLHFGYATMAIRRENTALAIKAKMAVSLRGYDISLYPIKEPDCYKLTWKNLDKIHSISQALLQNAYKLGLPSEKPAFMIPPAIDISFFKNKNLKIDRKHTVVKILSVARLKWVKGLEYSLLAIQILLKMGIKVQYTIIGDGEEYERLSFAAYQFGIQDWVSFKGKIPHDQVKSELENTDIYLQYSIQEGFCNAVLEAQALGLLCVVSNAEGLSENIIHGRTGWVVPKRQPRLLAEQIKAILEMDEPSLHKIRTNAVERVCNDFNLEKQQLEFIRFYTEE